MGGQKNPHSYDCGGDPAATVSYDSRAIVMSLVTVSEAAVFRTLSSAPGRVAHEAIRGAFTEAAEHHTQLQVTMKLVWLKTVHALSKSVQLDKWEAALPGPARWGEFWNWLAHAVCCRGAHGGSLLTGVQCGMCGRVRANLLCKPSADRMIASHSFLVDATHAAMASLASSFDAACHEHLPHRSSHARRSGVATIISTHTLRTVAVETRRLVWRVVTTGVDAGAAVARGGKEREQRHAAECAAAKSCLERGDDALQASHATKLEILPQAVGTAALKEVAAPRWWAKRAPRPGTAPLLPTGRAGAVARR